MLTTLSLTKFRYRLRIARTPTGFLLAFFASMAILPAWPRGGLATELFLNFESATGGSANTVTTPWGKVTLSGSSISSLIDPDIVSAGGSGNVREVLGPTGKGGISLTGAVATSVTFLYGGRANSPPAGGLRAYTFSSARNQTNPELPGSLFYQVATDIGEAAGPLTPPLSSPTNYFNSFHWGTAGPTGDVRQYNSARTGYAQIDNVRFTVDTVSDILRNPNSFSTPVVSGPKISFNFTPQGSNGPIHLADLAAAYGPHYDHFNWRQTMALVSPGRTFSRKLVNAARTNVIDDFNDPHVDPHPNNSQRIAYFKTSGPKNGQGLAIAIQGLDFGATLDSPPDSSIAPPDGSGFYLNETGPSGWQAFATPTSLSFEDSPRFDESFYDPGDYFQFVTELYAVASNGLAPPVATGAGYKWTSDAVFAKRSDQTVIYVNGSPVELSRGVFSVLNDSGLPPAIAGGASNVSIFTPPAFVAGDYNGNGHVDAADYVLWRNGGPIQNEVDTPGVVTLADYDEWRSRFGNISGNGTGAADGAEIPEPTAMAFLACVLTILVLNRRVTG